MTDLITDKLTFAYKKDQSAVLDNIDFKLEKGSFSLLYGRSGCGKSTFLSLLAGFYPKYGGHLISGRVLLDGQRPDQLDPSLRAQKVGMLFQNPADQFAMRTADEELKFVLENIDCPPVRFEERIDAVLKKIGIEKLRNRQIDTLSGGELQKLALAITLLQNSSIICLDEPFANVDRRSRLAILLLLKKLQLVEGKTILICDHDLSGYETLADHLYRIEDRKLYQENDLQNFFANFKRTLVFKKEFSSPEHQLPLLKTESLTIDNSFERLIDSENLTIFKNKMVLLTGPNGCGKSTFFKSLVRLHDFEGSIYFQDQQIKKIGLKKYVQQCVLLFQDPQDQYVKMTVKEELMLSLQATTFSAFWNKKTVEKYLSLLELQGLSDRVVYQLSGGQKKKLQILEMMILAPKILLMDEPLAGLDQRSVRVVMEIVSQLQKIQSQTIIMISHQLNGIDKYFDYHLSFEHKKINYKEGILENESIS
ncbi:ABC transporter ATP-binding protein [Oenococcus alcoholitolerans]|uniref:ABC transporter ATP-binding protein n=1 Tax=Oenococcus alcoholitolerans TaxID=931074 RepID=UPI003F7115FA